MVSEAWQFATRAKHDPVWPGDFRIVGIGHIGVHMDAREDCPHSITQDESSRPLIDKITELQC